MRKITATVPAYISQYNSIDCLLACEPKSAICQLILTMTPMDGLVWIGHATVTLEIADDTEINAELVETLRAVQKQIQADAGKRVTEIEQQIQSLLAIEQKVTA